MHAAALNIDKALFYALALLAALSLAILYSASAEDFGVLASHLLRLILGFLALLAVAQLRPEQLERWSPYIYAIGIILLLIVLGIGVISKGAQRWLNVGLFKFQPSEMMKLALPMMLAWFMAKKGVPPRWWHVGVVTTLAVIPALLIARQPDLGTAIMVFAAGIFVIFLAGMPLLMMILTVGALAAVMPLLWNLLHDYQRTRILTLFDPQSDPLGSGYHTIQSMIAIGSGGFFGKGWLNGTQAHLKYLPESSTDFVFAVFAEEFGLVGVLLVVGLYLFIFFRGAMIALSAQDSYSRLLAGGITLTFFFHFFINIGMVTGILPVVGIPLPMMSYGGSSLLTLLIAFGMLMSIQKHRRIVEF